MDAEDAPSAEMRQPPPNDPLALDEASVDRLLSGTLPAAGAPPGYAGVARLLAATLAPPTPWELAGEAAVLAELRAVTRERRAAASVRPARHRRRRAGLAVVVVVGALATGGVAAATGNLPGPVREAARSVLGPAGGPTATSPSPASAAAPDTGTPGPGGTGSGASASTAGRGPRTGTAAAGPAAVPALDGLCRAYLSGKGGAQGGKLSATAFETLAKAADGADKLDGFCERLLPEDTKAMKPKNPGGQDPAGGDNPGQGRPPPSTGGGSGQNQGSPPADRSASNSPADDGNPTRR